MKTLTYAADVRAVPLLNELLAAGVPVLQVTPGPPARVVVEDAAVDATVNAVVAAHNVAAPDQREDRKRQDRATILAYVRAATPSAALEAAFKKALARDHLRVLGELRDEDA